MKIDLTQENIDKGNHKAICSCPVALAINHDEPDGGDRIMSASVLKTSGHFTRQERQNFNVKASSHCKFTLPEVAQKLISDWDAGKEIQPTLFEITITDTFPNPTLCGTVPSLGSLEQRAA